MEYIINDESIVFVMRNLIDSKYGHELKSQLENIEWINYRLKNGNKIKLTRSIYILGDETIKNYPYTSLSHPVTDWNMVLNHEIKNVIDNFTSNEYIKSKYPGLTFNSCVINKYANGNEFVAPHSDDEAGGLMNAVVSISLGATRSFYLKSKNKRSPYIKIKLNHGDCLVMLNDTQKYYDHSVPSEKCNGSRISLTYRKID